MNNSITPLAALLDRGFDLDELVRSVAHVATTLATDAQIAKKDGDPAAVAITSRRLAKARDHQADHAIALPVLEKAENDYRAAIARRMRAEDATTVGTLSAAAAVKDEQERIVAVAAERHWCNAMPALRSAVRAPLAAILTLAVDEDAKRRAHLLDCNRSYIATLHGAYSQNDAVGMAAEHGAKLTGVHEAWLPLADAIGREDFERESKESIRPSGAGPHWAKPTIADLEKCLAARRGGLAASRRAAQQKVDALQAAVMP